MQYKTYNTIEESIYIYNTTMIQNNAVTSINILLLCIY